MGPPAFFYWGRNRDELRALRQDLYRDGLLTDLAAGQIERRLAAMEAAHSARWPRSVWRRRRLARDLRASTRRYAWVGPGFEARREQAISDEWGMPPGGTTAFPPVRFSSRPPGRHR